MVSKSEGCFYFSSKMGDEKFGYDEIIASRGNRFVRLIKCMILTTPFLPLFSPCHHALRMYTK